MQNNLSRIRQVASTFNNEYQKISEEAQETIQNFERILKKLPSFFVKVENNLLADMFAYDAKFNGEPEELEAIRNYDNHYLEWNKSKRNLKIGYYNSKELNSMQEIVFAHAIRTSETLVSRLERRINDMRQEILNMADI